MHSTMNSGQALDLFMNMCFFYITADMPIFTTCATKTANKVGLFIFFFFFCFTYRIMWTQKSHENKSELMDIIHFVSIFFQQHQVKSN